jgi:hypothetical protein
MIESCDLYFYLVIGCSLLSEAEGALGAKSRLHVGVGYWLFYAMIESCMQPFGLTIGSGGIYIPKPCSDYRPHNIIFYRSLSIENTANYKTNYTAFPVFSQKFTAVII